MSTESPPQSSATLLLGIAEVAHRTKVSKRTVEGWIASGELPSVKIGKAQSSPRRVREIDLEAFIADRMADA